ncbi:MAG: hypothetical protein ACREFK_13645, partial [Stellaceae bacterium]
VEAGGGATTVLKVEGNFTVTGPLETFANAGGVHLARAILAEFAENMAKLVAGRSAPAAEAQTEPAAAPNPPSQAGELRAGGILWRAFLSWLRQVFRGKGQKEAR